jgi:predicted ABC-type ATPase
MKYSEIVPTFLMVIGGAGSGKNHFIEHHPEYSKYHLVDVDAVKQEVDVSTAIASIMPMLESAFKQKLDVAHPGTAANLKAAQNKIELAKKHGYNVVLVLKDTPVDVALARVANRVEKGGHHAPDEKVIKSNALARQRFSELKSSADYSFIV